MSSRTLSSDLQDIMQDNCEPCQALATLVENRLATLVQKNSMYLVGLNKSSKKS